MDVKRLVKAVRQEIQMCEEDRDELTEGTEISDDIAEQLRGIRLVLNRMALLLVDKKDQ